MSFYNMKKTFLTFILFSSFFGFSQNQEIGNSFIQLLLKEKKYSEAYTFFDSIMKTKISEIVLKDTSQKLNLQLGEFKSVIETNKEKETYFYYSEFEKMKLDIQISMNDSGKIIGFYFIPHKKFKKSTSLGTDLNISSNSIDLKGTLLVPDGDGLKKLVIFIHGSGPNDRDETVFENKPFRDIAENLYLNGISSYRFDKKTFTNPESFTEKSTIDDEVTNDVLNIVSYFKNNKRFSDYQIILIGHSLGAHLLPRIANISNQISKIVMLAGNARPLDKLILEQYDYLYTLSPSEELKNQYILVHKQVEFLNSKKFNNKATSAQLPLNLSFSYWESLLRYNPIKEIKKVKIPILVLQGARDYQVTIKDFKLWQRALKSNKKSTTILYPKLNHLFIAGNGPSKPEEYTISGKVDEMVVSDIIGFINQK